jgi:hypothetical protein
VIVLILMLLHAQRRALLPTIRSRSARKFEYGQLMDWSHNDLVITPSSHHQSTKLLNLLVLGQVIFQQGQTLGSPLVVLRLFFLYCISATVVVVDVGL